MSSNSKIMMFAASILLWALVLSTCLNFPASAAYVEISSSDSPHREINQQIRGNISHYYLHQLPLDKQADIRVSIPDSLAELREYNSSITQRSTLPKQRQRSNSEFVQSESHINPQPIISSVSNKVEQCMYDKSYFSKLDECLARKPYPTVGLIAFKNEDLLTKKHLSEKIGCVFILGNGLFKNHQIAKYSVESDGQCLDSSKVRLSLNFVNVTQTYLWTLRCLNKADQLLDDATFNGETSGNDEGLCVGSSQNFGFTSLQLSSIDARVELATDIYKNWRILNIQDALDQSNDHLNTRARHMHGMHQNEVDSQTPLPGTSIREFIFESLDGDELNWRYLNVFQNWSRNKLHMNFLDQYRRFLWISIQRCLNENTQNIQKPVDIFSDG